MEQVSLQKLGNIVTPAAQSAVVSFPTASAAAMHGVNAASYIGLVQPPNFNAASLTADALPSADGYTWVGTENTQFTGLAASTSDHASCCRFG